MTNGQDKESSRFCGVKMVAVIGGTIDVGGNLCEDVQVCHIIEVGESDLLVRDNSKYTEKIVVVPKSLCIPLPITGDKLKLARKAVPKLGDLVLFYGKLDWKDKGETKLIGIMCEVKYQLGNPITATLLAGDEMKIVEYNSLLVLQRKH